MKNISNLHIVHSNNNTFIYISDFRIYTCGFIRTSWNVKMEAL